ncbi:hypothetical protein PANT111_80056 [Pantoea brenneri]|uniref:Uncharacterized protein n=1 Tax=Pantoea brenneri TaxID=472694 RepID=A0AAX3JCS7_9GAMM|nr:hypothetical protein PANT111_80056 [Pantoea brenneri]
MKDQITHNPDNAGSSVAKQKFRITNWCNYNKALSSLRVNFFFRSFSPAAQSPVPLNPAAGKPLFRVDGGAL